MRLSNLFKFFLSYLHYCWSLRILRLLHFLLVVFVIYIFIEWQHENNLFRNIGRMAERNALTKSDTSVVTNAMFSINNIMHSRHDLFKDQQVLKQQIFHSADVDLMYGSGACGGYSMVLARTLDLLEYKVRIGQLKTISYGYGGHIILEYYSKTLDKWVMIDPLFTWIPRNRDGKFASVREVARFWKHYVPMMNPELAERFQFTDVRYTNWTKMGGIPKVYYHLAKFFRGKTYADTICLRMYSLSTFPLLFWSLVGGYGSLMVFGFLRYRRK